MTRTCIICGRPARSGEHLFPATLGGIRENRGIYCAEHNTAYAPLVNELAEQLRFINAELEVMGQRSGEVKPASGTIVATGDPVLTTGSRLRSLAPPKTSDEHVDGRVTRTSTFSDRATAERWAKEERAQGRDVRIQRDATIVQHHIGTVNASLAFGGLLGLRAVAYITQTFFAEAFPTLARSPALDGLKAYTLNGVGPVLAWQVFDPIDELGVNAYAFGHRVVVSVDGTHGMAYAQLSLFGTYHVNVQVALDVGDEPSRTVITDIDPLAVRAPNDSIRRTMGALAQPLRRPDDTTAELRAAIESRRAVAAINALMRRVTDEKNRRAALTLYAQLEPLAQLDRGTLHDRVRTVLRAYSGHVLALIDSGVAHLRADESDILWTHFGARLVAMTARDATAPTGLSALAELTLSLCQEVFAATLEAELAAGTLTAARVEAWLGKGPGLELISRTLFGTVLRSQPIAEG